MHLWFLLGSLGSKMEVEEYLLNTYSEKLFFFSFYFEQLQLYNIKLLCTYYLHNYLPNFLTCVTSSEWGLMGMALEMRM